MSVSNTTSNTTPLPISADATDAAPLQISDEAREAARREDCSQACRDAKIKLDHESGYHVQLAINSATEKLQRENEALHVQLRTIVDILTDIRDTTLDFSSEEKAINCLKLFGVKEEK